MALTLPCNPLRVGFTCGSFDLLHAGHILMLEEVAGQCDVLIVGLQSDPSTDRADKNTPIQELGERHIQLAAVRHVDEVIIYDTEADLLKLLSTYEKVDGFVRFVGADWEGKPFTGHELDIEVIFNSRGHGYSTSELRRRVAVAEIRSAVIPKPPTIGPCYSGLMCGGECENPRGCMVFGGCLSRL